MKMTLNLTFEDGLKVAKAIKNLAIESGWESEELDECGVMEEYSRVVDVALAAMGIEVRINGTPSEEEEDDDDFDNFDDYDYDDDDDDDDDEDDGDTTMYSLTAKGEFVMRYMEAGHPFEEACQVADLLFGNGEDE